VIQRAGHGPVPLVILAAAGLAWAAVIHQAGGMESSAGTMGLGAAGFLALWTVMMAAMMLPALAPVSALYAGDGPGRAARAGGLAAGYLIAWVGFGIVALALSIWAGRLADDHAAAARWAGCLILIGAGVYQLTPLKGRCLTVCRSPLGLLARAGRHRGPLRHVHAGLRHGAYCVGCCWSLMVALVALGIMDLRWMVTFAVLVTLEKTWRHGPRLALASGAALVVLGIASIWFPGVVPGLQPAPMPMEAM
jgi:predicted metal-binding membrane protein